MKTFCLRLAQVGGAFVCCACACSWTSSIAESRILSGRNIALGLLACLILSGCLSLPVSRCAASLSSNAAVSSVPEYPQIDATTKSLAQIPISKVSSQHFDAPATSAIVDPTEPNSRAINVPLASRMSGITEEEFHLLKNAADYKGELSSWTTHTVDKRTTLPTLAQLYHTTPDVIVSINKIAAGKYLEPGTTVLVPQMRTDNEIPTDIAVSSSIAIKQDMSATHEIIMANRKDQADAIAKPRRVPVKAGTQLNLGIKKSTQTRKQLVHRTQIKNKSAKAKVPARRTRKCRKHSKCNK